MVTYVGLLRGVNVGGRGKVSMADLRGLHERLGHTDVVTYIQSGNVVFATDESDPVLVAVTIESAIAAELEVDVRVIVRTPGELAAVVAVNPYAATADPARIGIAFLASTPADAAVGRIDPAAHRPDEFALIGRDVHLHVPTGFGRTKLTNSYIEAKLGVAATTRNWRTVCRLRDLSDR